MQFQLSRTYINYLMIYSDTNARAGCDVTTWPEVIQVATRLVMKNSNGTLLLQTFSQHELVIANILFQQANMYRTTRMHSRSKHWHLLDYVITWQQDVRNVHLTVTREGQTAGPITVWYAA